MTVTEMILEGEADHALDEIADAVRQRRNTLATIRFAELQTEDKVRIVGNMRPRYLVGAIAEVVEKRITKVTILFPDVMEPGTDPYGKYAGRKWIFPPALLEKVEDDEG